MPRFRKGFIVFLIFLFLIFIGVGLVYFYYTDSLKPISADEHFVEYEIEPNTTMDELTQDLENKGLIKSAFVTKLVAQMEQLTDIKAGRFNVSSSMSPEEMLTVFNDADNIIQDLYHMQFLEGAWAKDYASVISQSTDYSTKEVLDLWNNTEFVQTLIDEYEVLTDEILNDQVIVLLEGYFAPNSYEFFKEATLEDITRTLIKPTNDYYIANKALFDQSEYSIHDLFKLASIVQFEASQANDQKMVASVFYNRLDIDQRLESSVTVCYALYTYNHWSECENNPTYESPYNTYLYSGLPVGPVSNPSHQALDAVLNPDESNYYFFIADVYGDGTVYFAETYEEHLALVQQYLEGREE